MIGNSETMTYGTSYVQGFGPESGNKDITPRRRSSRLNTVARGAPPPQTCATTIATMTQATTPLSPPLPLQRRTLPNPKQGAQVQFQAHWQEAQSLATATTNPRQEVHPNAAAAASRATQRAQAQATQPASQDVAA
ncbi:hypothetical protein ACFX2B_006551 [Malus domestica]